MMLSRAPQQRRLFRPPWLRAWLRATPRRRADVAGQVAAGVGMVAVVFGAAVAVMAWYGQRYGLIGWLPVGTWLTAGGVAALVLGLVAVIVSRLR